MTAQEIYDYIYKNVCYTHTNGIHAWSDWMDYKEENYGALSDARRLAVGFEIQIQSKDKKFRIICCIL